MSSAAEHHRHDRFTLVSILALVSSCAWPAASLATPLPDARLVIAKFIEATGGTAAHKAVHNRVSRGTISIPASRLDGTVRIYEAEPNLRLSETKFGAGGTQEGVDGKIAWSVLSTRGATIRQGDELALALRQADIDLQLHWQQHYQTAECAGVDTVDGHPAYKVVMTPASGPADTWYFDTKSGLMVRNVSQAGPITVTSDFEDIRAVDKLLIPFHIMSMVQGVGTANSITMISMTMTDVKQNVTIEPGRFDRPQAVKDKLAAMAAAKSDSAAAPTSPRPAPTDAADTLKVGGK